MSVGRVYEVEKFIIHEKYDKESQKNDIAILKLKEKMTFGIYTQPICLPRKDYGNNKYNCETSGYGNVDANSKWIVIRNYDSNCNSLIFYKFFPKRCKQ